MKLIAVVKPFEYSQNIYLFDEESKSVLEKIDCNMSKIDSKILDTATNLNIQEINISGPVSYTQKIKADIMNREQYYYNENKLKINLI